MENPNSYLYRMKRKSRETGRKVEDLVNPFILDAQHRQYQHEKCIELLKKCCSITGHAVISGGKMTRRMKETNASKMIKIGRETYYLFPKDRIPEKVFLKVVLPMMMQDQNCE